MNSKQLSFSKARESLTSILDRVEKTGEPVTILRRGKPAAVIVSHEMFEQRIQQPKGKRWRLAGSIKAKEGLDVDAAIEKGREKIRQALRSRTKLF
jgi:prevent-host-death family protein